MRASGAELSEAGAPAMIKCSGASFTALVSPSSRGPGRGPFKAKTRVRIPLGTILHPSDQSAPTRSPAIGLGRLACPSFRIAGGDPQRDPRYGQHQTATAA